MEIKSFKKLKDNRYKVMLDNGDVVTLYDDIIVEYNLLVNKLLDEKLLKEINLKNSEKEAYYIAIKMLNMKMRTKKEIEKNLKKYEYPQNIVEKVIKNLYKEGYLNEERYIKAYINDQVNLTDKGPNKIKRELLDLGLNIDDILDVLSNIESIVWEEKINKYITKKLKSTSNMSATRLKQKIIVDLINKGHYKELVMDLINNYEFITNDDLIIKEYNKIKRKLENKYEGSELKYYIKAKLLSKGFSASEIDDVDERG